MSDRGLSALYKALTSPLGDHLDDEVFAELANAEVTGEDIEARYPSQVKHIESCVQCAQAYSELVELMLLAVDGMDAAASAVQPVETYAALILRDLEKLIPQFPKLAEFVRSLTSKLPTLFINLPSSQTDIDFDRLTTLVIETDPSISDATSLTTAIVQGIQQNLGALSIYLERVANSLWGRSIRVKQQITDDWQNLFLSLGPQYRQAILGELDVVEGEWPLMQLQSGHGLPFQVSAWAERISPVACKIYVQIDRPGLVDAAGRIIELSYDGQTLSSQSDESGTAVLEPVPIAAIPQAIVRFRS